MNVKAVLWALAIAMLVIVACAVGTGVFVAVWSFYFLIRLVVIGVLFICALYLVFKVVRLFR